MTRFAAPDRVFVRAVPDSYVDCLRTDSEARIDVARARVQHEGYVAALRGLGVRVEVLEAEPACPDSCFVEDAAVVVGSTLALATRPGAETRRAEVAAVAGALGRDSDVERMLAPATLDGGDVMRAGDWFFVGMSTRTNREGVDVLARVAAREGVAVVPLDVRGGLHLKSACSLADPSTLVYDPRATDDAMLSAFRAAGLRCVEVDEPTGANVLAVGPAVLVSAAAPRTALFFR